MTTIRIENERKEGYLKINAFENLITPFLCVLNYYAFERFVAADFYETARNSPKMSQSKGFRFCD